jgi:hypothetical protein
MLWRKSQQPPAAALPPMPPSTWPKPRPDATYNALEDVVDAILATEATSVTDLALKARVLATRGVKDVGFYRPEDVIRFFADVQTFAAL